MSRAKLHDDWIEFLKLLTAHRVRFVVVGAHAVAAHGRPRLTADLDVFVEPTLANARRVVDAIDDFGFGRLDPTELTRPDKVVFMGREPFRIDVLTSIDGVSFPKAWAGRLTARLGGVRVQFIGRDELVTNKRAAGRAKDLADIALLDELESVVRLSRRSAKTQRRVSPVKKTRKRR